MFIFKAKEYQSEKSPMFDSQKSTKTTRKLHIMSQLYAAKVCQLFCNTRYFKFKLNLQGKGSPALRNGGGKSWFWTPSWLFLTFWTCGFSVFYVKEASCLISSSSATFTLSSFSSSMTSLISSSTCPILTFYTFLKTSHQMLVNGEEKKSWFDGLHTIFSDFHFVMKVFQRFKTQTESWLPKHIFIPSLNLFTLHHLPAFDLTFPERYKT